MCDAGGSFKGKLTKEEMLAQIDYMVDQRYPDRKVPAIKFKIQFARMGEPALNDAVLKALEELPLRYRTEGIMPCISTIAPAGRENFFDELIRIKNELFRGRFQLQFSIHSTNETYRDFLMPVRKWTLAEIAEYSDRFFNEGDRKITLNFAVTDNAPIDGEILLKYFDPLKFLVKLTPLNPTFEAKSNNLTSLIAGERIEEFEEFADRLRHAGFETLVSIGELEENRIGSNCGQYIRNARESNYVEGSIYTYNVK
jgi:23S rRNA (adenine2503-C2)-methyltransferase